MFKKSHRNEKKVIFDIFSKNNQTFCPENSDLKYSYTTLINGKNQSPVKSSRRVQPSLQSTERWQKLVINNVRLLSEEASITVKKLDSKLTDTAELELTCLVVNWCPTTWQNPICRPPFWISNGHHFQRACAAVFPPCHFVHIFCPPVNQEIQYGAETEMKYLFRACSVWFLNDWQISLLVQSCNPHTRQDQRPLPAPPWWEQFYGCLLIVEKLSLCFESLILHLFFFASPKLVFLQKDFLASNISILFIFVSRRGKLCCWHFWMRVFGIQDLSFTSTAGKFYNFSASPSASPSLHHCSCSKEAYLLFSSCIQ